MFSTKEAVRLAVAGDGGRPLRDLVTQLADAGGRVLV